MLPLNAVLIILATITLLLQAVSASAQAGPSRTASGGACSAEGHNLLNLLAQDRSVLHGRQALVERYLADIAEMEACAARQAVWVRGHGTADGSGCVDLEEFRGPRGDEGPRGEPGEDAACP